MHGCVHVYMYTSVYVHVYIMSILYIYAKHVNIYITKYCMYCVHSHTYMYMHVHACTCMELTRDYNCIYILVYNLCMVVSALHVVFRLINLEIISYISGNWAGGGGGLQTVAVVLCNSRSLQQYIHHVWLDHVLPSLLLKGDCTRAIITSREPQGRTYAPMQPTHSAVVVSLRLALGMDTWTHRQPSYTQ